MNSTKKKFLVLACCLILFGVGISSIYLTQDTAAPPPPAAPPAKIIVYVAGAVNQPGVIELPANSRVSDAIKACGDLARHADSSGVNLASTLEDGMQITVPSQVAPLIANAANASSNKVNINTADTAALDKLPGIGPAMAKRIIEQREKCGSFKVPEDLRQVRGIGPAKFQKLKDLICV